MDKKTKITIAVFIVVGFFLRVWRIGSFPFPPDGDEIAFGYYGWSLLNFRTDEFGNTLPLFFSSIGDFKYPGLAYLNMFPALIFGLSDITTRFWSVVSGVIAIPLIFHLSYFLTKNKRSSLFASLLFTFSPWSLIESRLGYENHPAFVITLAAVLIILKYKKVPVFIAGFLFILSIFTYAAQRFFVPVFLFFLLVFLGSHPDIKSRKKAVFKIFVLTFIVSSFLFLNPSLRGRADEEVWKLEQTDFSLITENYHSAGISPVKIHPRLTWSVHNKYTYSFLDFLSRYTDHFSFDFLFFKGQASKERIPGMGMLLFAEIVLLPVGIVSFLKKNDKKKSLLLLTWLLISPIPSALTRGGAHINRASLMIVPLCIFSGYGLYSVTNFKSRAVKLISGLAVSLALFWSIFYCLHQIFIVKPVLRPWYKQQVNKQLTQKVLSLKDNYPAVAVTDDDYIFYLFYGKISPENFQKRADIIPAGEKRWERVNRLDNIFFKMPFRCPLSGKKDALYVCEGDEIPQNSRLVDIVYFLDGVPAYTFIEFYPLSERPEVLPELPDRLHYMVGTEKPDGFPDGIIPEDYPSLW